MAKQTPYRMTKLDEIRPYDKNPRIIPQAAVDAVARSIQAFGFRQPIVVDGQGVILAGHTRYKAAQQLGLAEVPVVWQTDIDEIRAKGYRIADNKTAEISAWDRDQLDKEVQDIAAQCDFDIKDLGLADWEIQRILDTSSDIIKKFEPVTFQGQDSPAVIGTPISLYNPTETLSKKSSVPLIGMPNKAGNKTGYSILLTFETIDKFREVQQDIEAAVTKAGGRISCPGQEE